MDQIRTIFGMLWRERFWVLTTVGTIVAVACWYLSASDLDKQFESRKRAIDSVFNSTQVIVREPDHPNDGVIAGNIAQARIERDRVLKTWQDLYDEQREEVLKWPEGSLKSGFIEKIKELKFFDPFKPADEMDMRNEYANYIGTRLDALLEIVDALEIEGRSGRGEGGARRPIRTEFVESPYGRRGEQGEEEELDYLVEWLDQGNLREKLDFQNKPTAMEIWVTQEDLWVYETLLKVIASTNEMRGATRPGNTAVRTIFTLEVGREAALASREGSQILMPESADSLGGGYGRGEDNSMESRGGMGRGMDPYGDRGEGGAETDDTAVLAYRYLKEDGEPFEGEPDEPEFRRLPIHMELMMDVRWLTQLLVECANAPLPVEVTQVRINPEQSGGELGGGSGNRGRRPQSRRESGPRRNNATTPTENRNLVTVDIIGVVYIYNEPSKEVMSHPDVDEPEDESDQLANTGV